MGNIKTLVFLTFLCFNFLVCSLGQLVESDLPDDLKLAVFLTDDMSVSQSEFQVDYLHVNLNARRDIHQHFSAKLIPQFKLHSKLNTEGAFYIARGNFADYEPPDEIRKGFPYYLSGFDMDNRPIWIMEFGKWDLKTMIERGDKWEKALDKYVDQWLWHMYNSTGERATPESPVKEIIVIVDMDGYDLRQLNSRRSVGFILKIVRTITNGLKFAEVYMVNTNFIGQNLLTIIKPILGPNFERLKVYGTNTAKYWPVLLKVIPKSQIPEWYGGDKNFKPQKIYG